MKQQKKKTSLLALVVVTVILLSLAAMPTFAMGRGSMNGGRRGVGMNGRVGETTDMPPIGEGIESAVDDLTDMLPDMTEIPNATETDKRDPTTETAPATDTAPNENGGLMGDESLTDGTNIPDTDIGGAVDDNDGDGISDPMDSDDDNDSLLDSADPDADGDGQADDTKTAGVIGLVVTVLIVIAVIILVIAVIPRGKNKK